MTAGAADRCFFELKRQWQIQNISCLFSVNLSHFFEPFMEFILTLKVFLDFDLVVRFVLIKHVRDLKDFNNPQPLMGLVIGGDDFRI